MVLVSRYVLLPGAPAHPISWVLHACCLRARLRVLGALMVKPGPHSSRQNVRWKGYKLFFKPFFQFLSVDNFKKKCSVFSTPQ